MNRIYIIYSSRHNMPEPSTPARPAIISCAAWLWCIKFGALFACRLKRKHRSYGDTIYIDEVFVKINGKQHYLLRAVDQESLPHEVLWVR